MTTEEKIQAALKAERRRIASLGGKAAAATLTAEQRRQRALNAVQAREARKLAQRPENAPF